MHEPTNSKAKSKGQNKHAIHGLMALTLAIKKKKGPKIIIRMHMIKKPTNLKMLVQILEHKLV